MVSTNLMDKEAEYNATSDEVPPTQAHNNASTLKRKPTGSPQAHSPSTRKVSCQKIGDANVLDPSVLEGIFHSKLAELVPIGTPWPPEIEEIDDNDLNTSMLQTQIDMLDIHLRIRKEYDEMQAELTSTVESFNDLKAIATKALEHAWSEVEVAQAEVTVAKEKINILEAASNEEKIERCITEQNFTEALKKANGELQVALSDLGTALMKNNLLQTANNESMITINRLRAENKDTQTELNFFKNKNNSLEDAAVQWYNFIKKLKIECEEHTKDLKLARAELELLHKSVASSATVEAHLVDASLNDIADIENTAIVNTDTSGPGDDPSIFNSLLQPPIDYEDLQTRARVDRVGDPEFITEGVDIQDIVPPFFVPKDKRKALVKSASKPKATCSKAAPIPKSVQTKVVPLRLKSVSVPLSKVTSPSISEEEIDDNTSLFHRFCGKHKKKIEIPHQLEIDDSVFDAMFNDKVEAVGNPLFDVHPIEINEINYESSISQKKLRAEDPGDGATSVMPASAADTPMSDVAGSSGKNEVSVPNQDGSASIWEPTFEFCKRVLTEKDSCTTDPINAFNLLNHSVLPVDLETQNKLDLATALGNHFMLITSLIASTVDMNDRFTAVMEEKKKLIKSAKAPTAVENKAKTSDEYRLKYLQACKDRDEEVRQLRLQLADARVTAIMEMERAKKNHHEAVESLKVGFQNDRENALLELRSQLEKEHSEAMYGKDREYLAAIENIRKRVPGLVKRQLERYTSSRVGKPDKEDSGATQH